MSFYGSSFTFNGVSCEEFGLMLYDFDGASQGDSKYAAPDFIEDRPLLRTQSYYFGSNYKDPLEFKLVFGANERRALKKKDYDRFEMESIAQWLMDGSGYHVLEIDQKDMSDYFYKCVITDLETIEAGMYKWAFQCTVHCDSPYAYLTRKTFRFDVDGSSDVIIDNSSTANIAYYPIVDIQLDGNKTVSVVNHSDGDRTFSLSNFPDANASIHVDGGHGIITAGDSGVLNPYKYFNFTFPRLVPGRNNLTINGKCTVTVTCDFPANIGG